uniref:Uncharacterized protein n=1 Tax=Cacopsylla melanoneura TaxID=428564 RepID=A0A8D9F6K4_9HEMI
MFCPEGIFICEPKNRNGTFRFKTAILKNRAELSLIRGIFSVNARSYSKHFHLKENKIHSTTLLGKEQKQKVKFCIVCQDFANFPLTKVSGFCLLIRWIHLHT